MARKKNTEEVKNKKPSSDSAYIENAGVVVDQEIIDTLVTNYMPYAMSVIVSRAIPEIDGFKPSHRKILFTLYKMGLINGSRVKSSAAVGEVMKLHPHGDMAIYETMVRLSRGNESLLHPYVDSKGNFGKSYLRDTSFAASRYTEVKLMPICNELFADIDKDAIDMVDNFDGTRKEPALLPVTFPSILVNANMGIAVGMASQICPFNLREICQATIALIKDENADISSIIQAPDFPIGGQIIYNSSEMQKIMDTGRGSIRVRSRYRYDSENHCIEVTEIPPTTTVEAIIDKIIELSKAGRVKEISDIRDETDLGGLKIAIDIKRGVEPDKLMQKLFKITPLEDPFPCNFNVLIGAEPKVLGIRDILSEWTAFRTECVKRRTFFDLTKKKEKLHLLEGLEKILLDIDKAVKIVRETKEEKEVVPNLMIGFSIDKIQAEFVAEIKLRQLNREYILNRTAEISDLKNEIKNLEDILAHKNKLLGVIVNELENVIKKFGQDRKSEIIYNVEDDDYVEEKQVEEYPVVLFFTKEGYFKKITPQSLRMSGDQKLKEGDSITQTFETSNSIKLLFFTNKGQVYKSCADEFADTKASNLGDYVAAKLGMDEGETAIYLVITNDYKGYMIFGFENGKLAKVPLASYETKGNRKKLTGAYCEKATLCGISYVEEDKKLYLECSNSKLMVVDSARIPEKTTRNTQGVQIFKIKAKQKLITMKLFKEEMLANSFRYTPRTLPSAGYSPNEEDVVEQMTLV